jgi:hypothetical protein
MIFIKIASKLNFSTRTKNLNNVTMLVFFDPKYKLYSTQNSYVTIKNYQHIFQAATVFTLFNKEINFTKFKFFAR